MREVNITDNHKIPRRFRGKKLYSGPTDTIGRFASADSMSKKEWTYITPDKSQAYTKKDHFMVEFTFNKKMMDSDGFLVESKYVVPVQSRVGG